MLGVERFPGAAGDNRIVISDAEQIYKSCKSINMPVDFQAYLLAASPPGFDLHYGIRDHFPKRTEDSSHKFAPKVITAQARNAAYNPWNTNNSFESLCVLSSTQPKLSPEKKDTSGKSSLSSKKCSSADEKNGKKLGKRVSFADDLGGPLVHIRILTDRPQSPPLLRPDILSSLTEGSSASVTHFPPLKLNFSQPASDYMAFRNRVENNCVALENVILKDYDLAGTIKVKNIAFEKKVVVRYSTDSWESFTDVDAIFFASNGTAGSLPYDTFSFEIHVSPKITTKQKLQFAIMYVVNEQQLWDNNNGANYEVVSSQHTEKSSENHNTTDAQVFGTQLNNSWTQFCGWNKMSDSVPYY